MQDGWPKIDSVLWYLLCVAAKVKLIGRYDKADCCSSIGLLMEQVVVVLYIVRYVDISIDISIYNVNS